MFLYTKSKLLVANKFEKVITNDYGVSYYEIPSKDILQQNIYVPKSKRWKLKYRGRTNQNKIDYVEYRTKIDDVKIYYQLRRVNYASYKVGFYYIDIKKVFERSTLFLTIKDFINGKAFS